MRLWSIHPRYLDAKGLVALWREALLAQKVLQGQTRGYRFHPQLERFRDSGEPEGAVAEYLRHVVREAQNRGYRFDSSRISAHSFAGRIAVSTGQLDYEFGHLLGKLQIRDPELYRRLQDLPLVEPHPLFTAVPGGIANWEITGKARPADEE